MSTNMSLADGLQFAVTLDKVARTDGTVNGTAIRTGRDGYARMALLDIGTWTDGTHTFTFEQSADNSTWTALTAQQLDDPAGLLSGATIVIDAADEDDVLIEIGLLATEDYTRVVQVTASSTTGLVAGAKIATGNLRHGGGVGQPMSASGFKRISPSI